MGTRPLFAALAVALLSGCGGPPSAGLPAPVEQTRAAILAAAAARDWGALDSLARAGPDEPPFLYTLGPEAASPSAYWRAEGEAVLERLRAILSSTPTVQTSGIVSWPRWAEVPLDSLSESDRRHMAAVVPDTAGWYLPDGSYVGETVGIHPSGRWLSFVGGE